MSLQFPYIPFSHVEGNALCIDDQFISYPEFDARVAALANYLSHSQLSKSKIGIVINDHFDTYASIFAVWHLGAAYIPLHPSYPKERLIEIAEIADLKAVIVPGEIEFFDSNFPIPQIISRPIASSYTIVEPMARALDDLAYILFTSGSTGKPKGVSITFGNLKSFLEHNDSLNLSLHAPMRFLQMFDLTFDLSVVSFLLPLLSGGTMFHVSLKTVKYMEIYRLLEEYEVNYAILVPSVLALLKPYFEDIELPQLKYVGLSGEAVPVELTKEWMKCCPNGEFFNFYGPTEATIFCTNYRIPRSEFLSMNGIVSIGVPTLHSQALVVDEFNNSLAPGTKGELLIAGSQVTPGYIKNPSANENAFAFIDGIKYYRTGDVVLQSEDGNFFYLGRKDHQVKIQGYRIELSEVEFQIAQLLNAQAAAVVVEEEKVGSSISAFIKSNLMADEKVREVLKRKLPDYMIPARFYFLDDFPLNNNGKLDRKILQQWAYELR